MNISIEYGPTNKEVFLSVQNSTGNDIPIVISNRNHGFIINIKDKIGAGISFPSTSELAEAPGVKRIWDKDKTLKHSFDLSESKLPPGNYTINFYWSGVGSHKTELADVRAENIDMQISEDGTWEINPSLHTVTKSISSASFMEKHPRLIGETFQIDQIPVANPIENIPAPPTKLASAPIKQPEQLGQHAEHNILPIVGWIFILAFIVLQFWKKYKHRSSEHL